MINNETVTKLYKYSSADKYTLANLKTSTIFLNKISNFNDIHEMDFWFDWEKIENTIINGRINKEKFLDKVDKVDKVDRSIKKIMEETIRAFNKEYGDKTNEALFSFFYEKMRRDLQKNVHVSCFTTTPSNPTMWSHYADISSGIVQEYNLADIDSEIEMNNQKNQGVKYALIKVIYSDEKIELYDLLESYIMFDFYKIFYQNVQLYAEIKETRNVMKGIAELEFSSHHQLVWEKTLNLLATKSTNWSYENEWRLVQIDRNEIKNTKLSILPTKVYLGEKMDITIKELVIDLVECEILEASPNIFNSSHNIQFVKFGSGIT